MATPLDRPGARCVAEQNGSRTPICAGRPCPTSSVQRFVERVNFDSRGTPISLEGHAHQLHRGNVVSTSSKVSMQCRQAVLAIAPQLFSQKLKPVAAMRVSIGTSPRQRSCLQDRVDELGYSARRPRRNRPCHAAVEEQARIVFRSREVRDRSHASPCSPFSKTYTTVTGFSSPDFTSARQSPGLMRFRRHAAPYSPDRADEAALEARKLHFEYLVPVLGVQYW